MKKLDIIQIETVQGGNACQWQTAGFVAVTAGYFTSILFSGGGMLLAGSFAYAGAVSNFVGSGCLGNIP